MRKPLFLALISLFFCRHVCAEAPVFRAPEQMAANELVTNYLFNVADLNGDGKKDLVFLNAGHENMFVSWNSGTNTAPVFGHAERLWLNLTETVPENIGDALSLQMIDFDEDGDLDILTWGNKGAAWVKNSGTAQAYKYDSSFYFGIAVPRALEQVFAADWDKDGSTDLIVSDSFDYYSRLLISLTWYRNTGSDSAPVFGPRRLFKTSASPEDTFINAPRPFVTDWNNDGRPDIIGGGGWQDFAAGDRKLRLWLGTGNVDSLSSPVIIDGITGGTFFQICDWNEDGKKDVMVMDTLAFLRIYLNRGTDAAPAFSAIPDTLRGDDFCHSDKWAAQLIDWDRDGRQDLVYGGGFNQMCSAVWARVRLYINQAASGDPLFRQGRFLSCGGRDIRSNWGLSGRTMTWVDDMDADNDWDLYFAYRYASPLSFYYYLGGPATTSAMAFDTEMQITYGAGLDTFNTDMYPRVCDLDHDGLKDLLVSADGAHGSTASRWGQIWFLKNLGTARAPRFTDSNAVLLLTNTDNDNAQFSVCDMDGDSLEDIVVGCDTGNVRLFLNRGTRSSPLFTGCEYLKYETGAVLGNPAYPFHMRPGGSVTPGGNVVCAGDYDDDGVPDLLCNMGWIRRFTQWSGSGGFYLLRGVRNGTDAENRSSEMERGIAVIPNPFNPSALVRLSGPRSRPLAAAAYDIRGHKAADFRITREGAVWNAGNLPGGLYFIRAKDGNGKSLTVKAVLMK